MNQVIHDKFIPQQLLYFIAGRRCCQQFPCTYRSSDHDVFINCARGLGLRSQMVQSKGQCSVKIFKQACRHYLEEPKLLTLTGVSMTQLYVLLSRANFLAKENLDLFSEYSSYNVTAADLMQVYLPLPPCRPPLPRFKTDTQRKFLSLFPGYPVAREIVQLLYAHRVLLLNADLSWDKSLFVPLILLDDCELKKSNVKIVCIESESIVVSYNSQRLAEYFGEQVGETVGVQLAQNSLVSNTTHIIFSTAQHMLRTLASDGCHQISHFVVNDVHLHEPYTDILLSELRKILTQSPNLRVVLLSHMTDGTKFLDFFDEGCELNRLNIREPEVRVSFLEEIHSCIALAGIHKGPDVYRDIPELFRTKSQRNEQMDKCLQAYEELGTDASLHPFLYAINYDLVPVNYRHSVNGKTAVLIASQLNNATHLRLLLFMGADPYIVDEQQQNAISLAASKGNNECIDALNNYSLHGYVVKNAKPDFVDFDLIIDLMYLLLTKPEFSPGEHFNLFLFSGNIQIILPSYYHIVKLNYMLLSHCLTGNLQELSIFILHENIRKEYIDALLNAPVNTVKVLLTTSVIESLVLLVPFKYQIDCACRQNSIYDSANYCMDECYEWVDKESLARRETFLDPDAPDAHCFRLLFKDTFDGLPEMNKPHLQTMYLDKICLTVKLLAPNRVISEYLSFTISPPPLINVHHAVQFLKKIDVLDEFEDVTFLGLRLLDIPAPCQLGRMLIFGILLQCLDPILTIVSSLMTVDPLSIPFNEDIDRLWDKFTIFVQNRIKNERARLADNQFSDHFIFLRLFQEWQCRLKNKIPPLHLTDEYDFVLNGIMEQLNYTRSELVSALRTQNLIHSRGPLSIQNLNQMANNWHVIKAALTGGMYPNICTVDVGHNCLNSAYSGSVHLHPNTVLRDFLEPFNSASLNFRTPWILCNKQKNHIVYATVVVPLAVGLFAGEFPGRTILPTLLKYICCAGPTRLRFSQICDSQSFTSDQNVNIFIDEWIWLVMSNPIVQLIMKTRQYFFKVYHYLLRHCTDPEKWRRESCGGYLSIVCETLARIFESEDEMLGLTGTPPISYRPFIKVPSVYLLTVNSHFSWIQEMNDNPDLFQKRQPFNPHFVERQFFLLYTEDSAEDFYTKNNSVYIDNVLAKFARPIESSNRHIFVILYSKNPDVMISVSRAKTIKGEFTLKEYFRNCIPVYEILEACMSVNVTVPVFDGRLMSCLIDKRVGNIIMHLFAFRHHWIHKQ
ncbi:hypothetical protein KR018_006666 [Drosophila ironensis]|nr:hypothetical protein KR018_006666 [Drosophila ironensis]